MLPLAFVAMSALVIAMILVEGRGMPRRVYATLKMIAATLFVVVGVVAVGVDVDAAGSVVPRRAFVAGLLLSFLGDALLIPKGHKRVFLAGLVAFLLAHVAYVAAFVARGVDVRGVVGGVVFVAGPIALVLRWLAPRVHGTMWRAVVAYVFVISAMVCAAASATAAGLTQNGGVGPVLLLGALAFWCSDIVVARERFVAPGFINRVVGIPAYFFAQLLLIAGFA